MKSPKSSISAVILGIMTLLVIAVGVQSFFLVKLYGDARKETHRSSTVIDPEPSRPLVSPAPAPPNGVVPSNPFESDFFSGFGDDWHPFKEMERMREEMDQIFGQSLGRFQHLPGFDKSWLSGTFAPDADIQETESEYVITMDVPGADKANIDVSLENGVITLKGQREEVTEEKEGDKVLRSERKQGTFQRSFTLPGAVDEASMNIDYDQGVLKVTIKKAT